MGSAQASARSRGEDAGLTYWNRKRLRPTPRAARARRARRTGGRRGRAATRPAPRPGAAAEDRLTSGCALRGEGAKVLFENNSG